MSDYTTIRIAIEEQVATITLSRPEVKNAFNDVMLDELLDAYRKLAADPDVRVEAKAALKRLQAE